MKKYNPCGFKKVDKENFRFKKGPTGDKAQIQIRQNQKRIIEKEFFVQIRSHSKFLKKCFLLNKMEYVVAVLQAYSKFGATTRSLMKCIIHFITGKCELERICESSYAKRCSYEQCREVEYCLYHSKHEALRKILLADKMKVKTAMEMIMRQKRIVPEKSAVFLNSMPRVLKKLVSYNALLNEVDRVRSTEYDEQNPDHEEMLKKLWSLLKKDDVLTDRYSSRWGEIGFQGKNPATDFRGMGILSLQNMLFLLEKHEKVALKIFGQSLHPKFGFSFAIVAINFTGAAFDLLRNGKLKGLLYNTDPIEYDLEHFHAFFVEIFSEFSDYWLMCEPENIMCFNELKKKYITEVEKRLSAGTWTQNLS